MKQHYVLVDFENVQPRNLGLLRGGGFHIKIFLGSQQSKLDVQFVRDMQAFGEDVDYVQMAGTGKNALDFHLAYFLGKLSAEHPGATYSIISRDTGFDPLVRYLKAQGIDCKRSAAVTDIPHVKAQAGKRPAASPAPVLAAVKAAPAPVPAAPAKTARKAASRAKPPAFEAARLDLVLQNLRKRDKGLPKTLRTLRSTMASLLVKPAARDGEVDALLAELQRRKLVAITGARVDYSLG